MLGFERSILALLRPVSPTGVAQPFHFTLKLMAHESYLSDDDYPYWWEHLLAPSFEQLAGTVEQVQACMRELPLTEAAELLGPTYGKYLSHMCNIYAQDAAQVIPYANALVAVEAAADAQNPAAYTWAEARAREMRLYHLARIPQPDYVAVLADCSWLTRLPLPGVGYWLEVMAQANPELSPADWWQDSVRYDEDDRQRRTGYLLIAAWAHYRQGDMAAAAEAFTRAFEFAPFFTHSFGWEWEPGLLPPVPDANYLNWQIDQQLATRRYDNTPPGIQYWLREAFRWLNRQEAN